MVIEGQGLLIGGKLWGKRAVVGEKKAFKLIIIIAYRWMDTKRPNNILTQPRDEL